MLLHWLTAVALLALIPAGPPVAQALSFWESQFSTSEFAQYRYKNLVTISVFQHLTKNASFYISPLVLLDHRSGTFRFNALTDLFELRFKVIMWDAELQDDYTSEYNGIQWKTQFFPESVATYLTMVKGVAHPEVKMLPMEKVRFAWPSRLRPIKSNFVMETEVIATHHLPRFLTLTFACKFHKSCLVLNDEVKENPEILDSLTMDCFLSAKKSATKTITVSVNNVASTKTFSSLQNLPPDGNFWYMRSEDFNGMIQEAFSNVRSTTIRSSEYVDKHDELNMMKLIEDALRQDEIVSNRLREIQWDSVYWNPEFARPDRVVKEAANVFVKNATTSRMDVNSAYLMTSDSAQRLFTQGSFGILGFGIGGSLSMDSDASSSSGSTKQLSLSVNQLNDLMREATLNVQWEGERFVVKPMSLVRINRRQFTSRRELVSQNIQLTVYNQFYSLKVIVKASHNETWLLPPEGSRTMGFPTGFSYCLLSNGGSCPPGFRRSSGFLKAISMDTSPGMIQNARLGDSAIKCHSPEGSGDCAFRGWEPYKGELHLHVCCR